MRNDQPALVRETFWFAIEGTRSDSEGNESPTSTSYGYRQEQRAELEISIEGEAAFIDTQAAVWTAVAKPLASAPTLRDRKHVG